MSLKPLWCGLGLCVLGVLATAWWTPWLDAHVPQLADWRQQARHTALGQALSPAPEPHWVTMPGRDKAACLRQTQGELNEAFVLCRSGWRELVRDEVDGRRMVLRREALVEEQGLRRSAP